MATPTIRDAADAAVEIAQKRAGRALAAAGQGLITIGDLLTCGNQSGNPSPTDRPAEREDNTG